MNKNITVLKTVIEKNFIILRISSNISDIVLYYKSDAIKPTLPRNYAVYSSPLHILQEYGFRTQGIWRTKT